MSQRLPPELLKLQIKALLEGSQPREPTVRRRKPNPLYSSGSAGGSKRRSGSQPSFARRSKSQPPSPTGVCKPKLPPGGSGRQRNAGCGPPGSVASAGTSPVKQEAHTPRHASLRSLNFPDQPAVASSRPTAAAPFISLPNSPQQELKQVSEQRQRFTKPSASCASTSQQLPDLERLQITSPDATPQSSPCPGQPSIGVDSEQRDTGTPPSSGCQAGRQAVVSLDRHKQRWWQEPSALEPCPPPQPHTQYPGKGDENWYSTLPSPSPSEAICCNQEGAVAAASSAWHPSPASLGSLCWQGSPQKSRPQAVAEVAGQTAGTASQPPAAAPPSLFNSSQERRQEIALLCEMAADLAVAWSSQEEEPWPLPQQHKQQQPEERQRWEKNQQPPCPQHEQAAGAVAPPPAQQPFRDVWASLLSARQAPPTQQPEQQQVQESGHTRPWQQQQPALAGTPSLDTLTVQSVALATCPATAGACSAGMVAEPSTAPAVQAGFKPASSCTAACQGAGSPPVPPLLCSFTSQELSEAAAPWTQPAADWAQQQHHQQPVRHEPQIQPQPEQQQEGTELDKRAAGPPQQQQQQQAHPPVRAMPAETGAPRVAAIRQQYSQQQFGEGGRVNQWAVVGEEPALHQPHASSTAFLDPIARIGLQRDQQQQEREDREDLMVASTCPLPQLSCVRGSFGTQREAFEAADRHNHCMPLAPRPVVVMSQVPLEELLPSHGTTTAAGASEAAVGCRGGAHTGCSASGGSSSTLGLGSGDSAGIALQSDSASSRQQEHRAPAEAQCNAAAGSCDFLTRFQVRALPRIESSGYTAPIPKRQRDEAAAGNEAQQQQQVAANRSASEQYKAALLAHKQAVEQALQQQQAHQEQRQGAGAAEAGPTSSASTRHAAVLGAAGLNAAAGEAADWREEERRQEAVRAFCVERRGRNGAYYRSFTAASYPAVWQLCRRTRCQDRHWYEVIREGRPAHLYFDLEYPTRLNPQADGDALVDALLRHVAAQLKRHYGLQLDPRCVYELDSSTPHKFSRHLTLHLPRHAFANNHAMGKFVAQVLVASGSELLVVKAEAEGGGVTPQLGSVVDMAVYSKNRHWRMSYCCKAGKAAVLLPTERYATAPDAALSAASVFLDTLVCNVDPRARLLQMPDPLPIGGPGIRSAAIVSAATVHAVGDVVAGAPRITWKRHAFDPTLTPEEVAERCRLAEAALPFIESVATQRAGGLPTRARTTSFCGPNSVTYSMIGPGSHFCENKGRPHTSNHVYFMVDFEAGTYAQKCHDPDCAHFRSTWMPLPPHLCLTQPTLSVVQGREAGLPPPSPAASSPSTGGKG